MTDRQGLEALAPCPFCGNAAEYFETVGFGGSGKCHKVLCSVCISSTPNFSKLADAATSWNTRAASTAADREEVVAVTQDVVDYVSRYGGRCRECADHDGTCAMSSLPCKSEDSDKAIRHVLRALNYGVKHGFLSLRATTPGGDEPVVSIQPMALSGGRTDYFVSIKIGDREVTPHVFREEYKAAYHVALYDWLLNGGEEPDLMAFDENDWPARKPTPVAVAEWRPVVGFEDSYEVSSEGDIRNKLTGKTLAKNSMGSGYIKADLWSGNARKQTSVHRVVAEAFLAKPLFCNEVNHLDGDKTNNRVSNLEWSNRRDNTNHSRYVLGNDVKPVLATDLEMGTEEYYPSIEEAGRYGYNTSCICDVIHGRRKTHAGKTWKITDWRDPATHPAPASDGPPVTLMYTNYRGETALRTILPKSIRFGSTEWHPEPQWLLLALDVEKNADREFALKDFGQPSDGAIREALQEAIDVFEGMNDDEINVELLPRLKAALAVQFPAAEKKEG